MPINRTHAVLVNNAVRDLADVLKDEAKRVHDQMDWPSWRTVKFSLEVTFSPDSSEYHLEYSADGNYIRASTLDALVKEVSRRLNFEDTESARIAASMKALPAPEDDEDNLIFDDSVPF
jgi:hypothetical protein